MTTLCPEMALSAPGKPQRGKGRRIYERYFSDVPVFSPGSGSGFSPLPWIYRRMLWLFSPREWQLLTYLLMRSGPEGVCWQSDKEIAFDLGIGPRKLAPHVKSLRDRGFIRVVEDQGQRYICLPEPIGVLRRLAESGEIRAERLQALNDDLEVIGLVPIVGPPPGAAPLQISASLKEATPPQG